MTRLKREEKLLRKIGTLAGLAHKKRIKNLTITEWKERLLLGESCFFITKLTPINALEDPNKGSMSKLNFKAMLIVFSTSVGLFKLIEYRKVKFSTTCSNKIF